MMKLNEWEIVLTSAGASPDAVVAVLMEVYKGMTPIEAQHLLSLVPVRLQFVMSHNDQHPLKARLENAGATLVMREVFTPFSVRESFFRLWLHEHPDCREVYRFTYLPSFYPPLTIWIWYDWTDSVHAVAKLGNHPPTIHTTPRIIFEKHWLADDEVWLTLLDLLEQHAYWDTEKWPSEWGIDGATWHLEGYRNGRYKHLSEWGPDEGPSFEIGHFFFSLVPPEFGELVIY
jgi:hypothetical protein